MQHRLTKGDRIRLVSMPHDPDPIPIGSLGTVVDVHEHSDWTQVDVDWDNGRSLMLTMPDDCVVIVEPNLHEPMKQGNQPMSTRATIACKREDGRYAAIYLHFDGYEDHAGRVLKKHYTSSDSAQMLVAGGDMRSLTNDGTPERFTDGNRAVVMPTHAALQEFARNCGAEYVYVFEDGDWHCHRL